MKVAAAPISFFLMMIPKSPGALAAYTRFHTVSVRRSYSVHVGPVWFDPEKHESERGRRDGQQTDDVVRRRHDLFFLRGEDSLGPTKKRWRDRSQGESQRRDGRGGVRRSQGLRRLSQSGCREARLYR